jgi:hypothetical protein
MKRSFIKTIPRNASTHHVVISLIEMAPLSPPAQDVTMEQIVADFEALEALDYDHILKNSLRLALDQGQTIEPIKTIHTPSDAKGGPPEQ